MDDIASRYTICAANDVIGELGKRDFAAVISIEHPGATEGRGLAPRLTKHGIKTPQYILTFWDHFIDGAPDMFTNDLALESLELMRRYRGQPLLIHCKAGKARSAGIALMGIAEELGPGKETEAVELLDRIRPIATPNPLVVQKADEILERHGALMRAVSQHPGIQSRMDDYYDAIERSIRKQGQYDPEKAAGLADLLNPERTAVARRSLEAAFRR